MVGGTVKKCITKAAETSSSPSSRYIVRKTAPILGEEVLEIKIASNKDLERVKRLPNQDIVVTQNWIFIKIGERLSTVLVERICTQLAHHLNSVVGYVITLKENAFLCIKKRKEDLPLLLSSNTVSWHTLLRGMNRERRMLAEEIATIFFSLLSFGPVVLKKVLLTHSGIIPVIGKENKNKIALARQFLKELRQQLSEEEWGEIEDLLTAMLSASLSLDWEEANKVIRASVS